MAVRPCSALALSLLTLACSTSSPSPGGAAGDVSTTGGGQGKADCARDGGCFRVFLPHVSNGSPPTEWPNARSRATSDPWLATYHRHVRLLRPRVLALHFDNTRSLAAARAALGRVAAALSEASRPHGYRDAAARPFVEVDLVRVVDLRDTKVPDGWPVNNSTRFPRENPPTGRWGFDYEQLFGATFAKYYGYRDPANPSRYLTLCELSERGLVHEVWVYADGIDLPGIGAAELLGLMPRYDSQRRRIAGAPMDRCAGNGCFDADDEIPATCSRTLRIMSINSTRGPGCALEAYAHMVERIGTGGYVPYFSEHFKELAGFDLDSRYGRPFSSWYACKLNVDCLGYDRDGKLSYDLDGLGTNPAGSRAGSITGYTPVCGNAHFPPNARKHYDTVNEAAVASTCSSYRTAGGPGRGDPATPVSSASWARYADLGQDCVGSFLIWWWQNFPGPGSAARDRYGRPMLPWWTFLYY